MLVVMRCDNTPHAVVVVLLEHHATDFFRHAIPPRAGIYA
jgi:hypothetical protein